MKEAKSKLECVVVFMWSCCVSCLVSGASLAVSGMVWLVEACNGFRLFITLLHYPAPLWKWYQELLLLQLSLWLSSHLFCCCYNIYFCHCLCLFLVWADKDVAERTRVDHICDGHGSLQRKHDGGCTESGSCCVLRG